MTRCRRMLLSASENSSDLTASTHQLVLVFILSIDWTTVTRISVLYRRQLSNLQHVTNAAVWCCNDVSLSPF